MNSAQLQQYWHGTRVNPLQSLKPYRVIVCRTETAGNGKRAKAIGSASVAWNPYLTDHWAQQGRLETSGSFSWLGENQALLAVEQAFADSGVHQVQVRTEQDRKLLIFNRHSDGAITHYDAQD